MLTRGWLVGSLLQRTADCDHGSDDCYTDTDGSDYRGSIAQTASGLTCQMWSQNTPHTHTYSHISYPHAGLGGHNHCRNPGHSEPSPWCFTTSSSDRWELCAVPPPQASCSAKVSADATRRYHTLCPFDCKDLIGNGQCDLRCNITSCGYDEGDCGVGFDLLSVLADQGYVPVTSTSMYMLVAFGVVIGVSIGLVILRTVLQRLKSEELRRRGYTTEERRRDERTSCEED